MTVYDPAGYRCSNRLYEWATGFGLFGYGLHVMVEPLTLAHSRYAAITLVFSPAFYGLCCFVVGSMRLISLYKNGSWPVYGPRIRTVLAIGAAVMFGQLAFALTQWTYAPASPGMWIYWSLVGAELRTIWRTVREQKNVCRV